MEWIQEGHDLVLPDSVIGIRIVISAGRPDPYEIRCECGRTWRVAYPQQAVAEGQEHEFWHREQS